MSIIFGGISVVSPLGILGLILMAISFRQNFIKLTTFQKIPIVILFFCFFIIFITLSFFFTLTFLDVNF